MMVGNRPVGYVDVSAEPSAYTHNHLEVGIPGARFGRFQHRIRSAWGARVDSPKVASDWRDAQVPTSERIAAT
jgi:hypothetical protein